jgi:ATP-dependent exoDNAse (exonuclease V) beta subunit
VDSYLDLKRRGGKLDFNDLLILVRDLLRSNREVREYLQRRYSHIFVDEFQDTDPLQAEILILLSSGDAEETSWLRVTPAQGKLFLVGDPKQSIYKFRRADLSLYREVCEALIGRGVGHVKLTRSFRSVRPIQEFVNASFAPEMTGDAASGQAQYSPLDDGAEAIEGQPSIVALPPPRPYGRNSKITKKAINECLPDTIVAYVEWLLKESGWKVRDAADGGRLVPLQNQHIALLFRRFMSFGEDITRAYVRAFEARDIPHLLVGSKSFHAREEIETMRAALSAIEWPDDELSVFATLKGSLFALPDQLLLRYRHEVGRLHPFAVKECVADFAPVREALNLSATLHRARNKQPIAETIHKLLDHTRAHAGFAFRPAGHQVLANVYRIVTMARNFELTGGISFRAFVEELAEQAERPGEAEAPVLEEGAEGVRLMTVHNAKGLEFPVVILADMTAKICANEADRYIHAGQRLCATRLLQCAPLELLDNAAEEKAREKAEGVRVAYVAATRARDLLVVPGVGDEAYEGWLAPLNHALYPPRDRWRKPAIAPGCPTFGDASILDRPMEFLRDGEFSVHPGLHGDVVWWDPSKLRLNVQPKMGLVNENLLVEGDPEGLQRFQDWQQARRQTIEQGRQKSVEIVIPSEGSAPGTELPVEMLAIAKQPGRPSGRRFGTLVHALLRDADLNAGAEEIQKSAESQGRTLGAPASERAAASRAVTAVLSHSLLQSARGADRCLRESPVTLPLPDGKILEGTVDLAFLENGTWTVVDFKTDVNVAAHRTHYVRQLQWYAAAFAEITKASTRAILFDL